MNELHPLNNESAKSGVCARVRVPDAVAGARKRRQQRSVVSSVREYQRHADPFRSFEHRVDDLIDFVAPQHDANRTATVWSRKKLVTEPSIGEAHEMSLEDEIRSLRSAIEQLTDVMKKLAGADPTLAPRATVTSGEKNIEELWGVKEVAAYLKMSRSSVYASLSSRDPIPCMRLGSLIRFDPDIVKAWTKERQARPATLKNQLR